MVLKRESMAECNAQEDFGTIETSSLRGSRVVLMVENDRMAIMLVDTAFLKAAFLRFCFRKHILMMIWDACMQ